MNRIEACLFVGPAMAFYLLGDHIAGQMTLVLPGQTSAVASVVGESLVLRKFPGQAGRHDQYVRVAAEAPRLRDWVEAGAVILLCSSRQGMASGVEASLADALGETTLRTLRQQGRLRRDVY